MLQRALGGKVVQGPLLVRLRKLSLSTAVSSDRYVSSVQPGGLPTDYFQQSLPRLPIPKLRDTFTEMLNSAKCLLSDAEFAKADRLVDDFVGEAGAKAQDQLLRIEKQYVEQRVSTNFFAHSEKLFELSQRQSLLPKSGMQLYPAHCLPDQERLVNVAQLIVSFARLANSIDDNVLPPSVILTNKNLTFAELCRQVRQLEPTKAYQLATQLGAIPENMEMFFDAFRGARLPRPGCDERICAAKSFESRHICVFYHGHMFVMQVLDAAGCVRPARHVYNTLKQLMQLARSTELAVKPGICTAVDRNLWAELRTSLCTQDSNRKVLREIETALFAVAVDDETFSDPSDQIRAMLLGDYGNRFLDKDLQILSNGNGAFGQYMDESWSNGVPTIQLLKHVINDVHDRCRHADQSSNQFADGHVSENQTCPFHQVTLSFTSQQMKLYEFAKADYDAQRRNLDLILTDFPIGAQFAKDHKISMDCLLHLAIQLAWYSLNGKKVPKHMAPCSLTAFQGGRIDDIMITTSNTKNIIQLIDSDGEGTTGGERATETNTKLLQLIKEASKEHRKNIEMRKNGLVVISHICALHLLSQNSPENQTAIFHSEAMKAYNEPELLAVKFTMLDDVLPFAGCWSEKTVRVVSTVRSSRSVFTIALMRENDTITAKAFSDKLTWALQKLCNILRCNSQSQV